VCNWGEVKAVIEEKLVGRWSKDGTSPGPAEEIASYLNWTAATTLWQLRDTVASPVVDPAIPV
jgi:hypothetical protein